MAVIACRGLVRCGQSEYGGRGAALCVLVWLGPLSRGGQIKQLRKDIRWLVFQRKKDKG